MTREQELEKIMKWIGDSVIEIQLNILKDTLIIVYVDNTRGVTSVEGHNFEECVRKAMQQEGEL